MPEPGTWAAAFPPAQLAFLAILPPALWARSIRLRHELALISQLPPFRPPVSPAVEGSSKTCADEKRDGSLNQAPPEGEIALVKIEHSTTRAQYAFRGALCLALVVLDVWLVKTVCSQWYEVLVCVFFGLLTALEVGQAVLLIPGVVLTTLGKKADDSVREDSIAGPYRLHPAYFLPIHLAAFAIFPSLAFKYPVFYPLIPLSFILRSDGLQVGKQVTLKDLLFKSSTMWQSFSTLVCSTSALSLLLAGGLSEGPADEKDISAFVEAMHGVTTHLPGVGELLFFVLFGRELLGAVSCLSRLDYPLRASDVDMFTLAAADTPEGQGKTVIVPSIKAIVRKNLKAVRCPSLGVSYSGLATAILVACFALPPVLLKVYCPEILLASFVPYLRIAGAALAIWLIPAAILALAYVRGEYRKVMDYEEDWGVKDEEAAPLV